MKTHWDLRQTNKPVLKSQCHNRYTIHKIISQHILHVVLAKYYSFNVSVFPSYDAILTMFCS